ncbi:Puf6p SKDI_04G6970 [Saccharomyces kudriavzevii IFO 1802]|uniref:Uncharacterized protein n=2 Tax=Saccharomyces kudriavzevii (strain ATCC MYA-4449 / AS 2.2408 / CBS 8840 / NBRC 1802 / NCYC 2889) TaxID=226230 RepID=A0AA35NPG4_SACK1|nr:uncharacterized protein SKDI_04G6970 [Saccharomyces kudriavzevii IFO 1802]EJT43515.1 PUF6-like protein [Saccharomyces kudriavzevii IFO 1802]CAI4059492.1 hypothetical protein SKDI_04G6970 [Saccharomyces kudriavzevii IFO 1802]
MAPLIKKTNGKRSAKEVSQSEKKSAKKPRISIDSSDEELELAINEDVEPSSSDDDDDLDDLNSSGAVEDKKEIEEADELDISDDNEEDEDEEDGKEGKDKSEDGEGGNHTEQRKLLKERKMQRKSGTQVQQIKSVWERLRVKTPPLPKQIREKLSNEIWELSKDCISDLVLKHDASRIVQTLVKYSSKERREQIVDALKGKFYVLATSAYGKYLLVKLLHYGSRTSRQAIINELHGSLRKLMRHREGAYVVEDLFVLYATHEQRQQMIKEFWGSEYAFFRETHKDLSIEKVCESSVEKRNIIARNLIGTITASVEKGSTGFQILHAAMREYVKIANEKEISDMIDLLHEQFAELVHTPEGSDVACTLVAKANAKERKLILKALKNHGEKLIKNEYGNIVFITILNCIDDTVSVFKTFSPTVKEHLQEFIIDKFGRRPWLYILLGLHGKYFSPIVKNELLRYIQLSEATSKKEPLQRRHELLSKFAPMFLSTISKNYSDILTENLGCQFVVEVLINDELYAQLSEKDQEKYQQVLHNILTTFKGDITEEEHPIHRVFSTRLLKALIQGGKWNNKEKKVEPLKNVQGLGVPFAHKLYDEIIDSSNLLEWINNADSSFTVVALYETLKDQKEGKEFLKDLKEIQSKITSDQNNKGSHLLVKLLK